MLALPGEAAHPDAVGDEEVVQRPVHRLEERAAIGPVVGVGERRRGIVEPAVRPGVIGGEHGEG